MHDDLSVGFASQVVVIPTEKLISKTPIIRQLPVERKTEPLSFLKVVPLKRLRIASVIGSASRVPDMPNTTTPEILPHETFGLPTMRKPKDFTHRTDILVGIDQLLTIVIERGNTCSKLSAILNVQQHPRKQPTDFIGSLLRAEWTRLIRGHVVDRCDAALVKQLAHEALCSLGYL